MQIGPDQNYTKSLLLKLQESLAEACFQERVVVGRCQEQGKALGGISRSPPRAAKATPGHSADNCTAGASSKLFRTCCASDS